MEWQENGMSGVGRGMNALLISLHMFVAIMPEIFLQLAAGCTNRFRRFVLPNSGQKTLRFASEVISVHGPMGNMQGRWRDRDLRPKGS